MRFKLNSVHFGGRAVGLIVGLLVGAPAVLYLAHRWLESLGYPVSALLVLMRVAVALGLISLVLFVTLLLIEYVQDRWLDGWHSRRRNEKVPLADGAYECQFCGSQKVRDGDRCCPVCGHALHRTTTPERRA